MELVKKIAKTLFVSVLFCFSMAGIFADGLIIYDTWRN